MASRDTDADRQSDGGEMVAGTSPLDCASLFLVDGEVSGTELILSWPAVTSRMYVVESAGNLGLAAVFGPLVTGLEVSGNQPLSTNLPPGGYCGVLLRVRVLNRAVW